VIARTRKLTLLATALIMTALVLAGFINLYPVTPQVVLASPDTLVLRPDGAGDSTELTPFPTATANWDCVDDVTSDGVSTYVYSDSKQFGSDFYNFANTSQTGSIDSVTVWMKVQGTRAANNVAKTLIKTNGVVYEGKRQDVTTGYSDISTVYDENPQSNAPWTWDEINLLQAGCALKRAGPSDTTRCTQVWVVVDYTDEYTLTINIVGNGSVAKSPDQATYLDGDTVQLTATADPGWSFDSWSGDLTDSTNPDTITIDGDKSVTATFAIYAIQGGWGGGTPPQPPPPPSPPHLELQVNVLGHITPVDIGEDSVLAGVVIATSSDGRVTLTFAEGTQVLSPDGNPPAEITVETMLDPPDTPDGYHVIEAFYFGPDGASFSPLIEIAIRYDPDALPQGVNEANLVIAYYDEAAGEWVFVTGVVHPAANTVTFSAGHFTAFAILGACAAAPTPTPQLTSTPTTTPGLGTDSWIGMGLCFLGLFSLVVGLIIRRRS